MTSWRIDSKNRWFVVASSLAAVGGGVWVIWNATEQLSRVSTLQFTLLGKSLFAGWFTAILGFAVSVLFLGAISRAEVVPPFERGGLWAFVKGPRPEDAGRARFWFRVRIIIAFWLAILIFMILLVAANWLGLTRP